MTRRRLKPEEKRELVIWLSFPAGIALGALALSALGVR